MGQMEDVSSFSMPTASALAPVSSFSFSQASAPVAPAAVSAPASNPNTAAIIQQAIARNKKLMAEKTETESAQVQQAAIISTPAPKPAHVAAAQTV